MSRYDEIKYHSQQKQNCIKFAKTNKRIGVLSSCIGVASTILACTCTFNDGTDLGDKRQHILHRWRRRYFNGHYVFAHVGRCT